GNPLWSSSGILICQSKNTFDPYGPPRTQFTLIADGMGGAIITWKDRSHITDDRDDPAYYDPIPVYSQRISSDGELLWGENTATGITGRTGITFPGVVPDGTGGAIFAWNDYKTVSRGVHDDFLRLQKLSPDGLPLWGDDGVLITASSPRRPLTEDEIASGAKGTFTRSLPTYDGKHDIVSDGSGGVVVFWTVEDEDSNYVVYAQRVDNEGNLVWQDKVAVGPSYNRYPSYEVVSDNSGGVIIATTVAESDLLRLQHVTGNGEVTWQYETIGYHA
ncbi:unnamed protein product, partial [marine sediment metagenome]